MLADPFGPIALALRAGFPVTGNGNVGAVAGGAIPGGRLVKQDLFIGHFFEQFVTLGAFHVLVRPPQGKSRSFVVIKQRRFPFHAVVTVSTGGGVAFRELHSVDVVVAVLAELGRGLEIHIGHFGFEVGRFMAVDAGRSPVRPQQRKLGLGMIEVCQLFPRLGGVACLAAEGGSIGCWLEHGLAELTLVDIFVTTGTSQVFPVINNVGLGLEVGRFLVAIGASYGDMPARQHKTGLLMFGEGEG